MIKKKLRLHQASKTEEVSLNKGMITIQKKKSSTKVKLKKQLRNYSHSTVGLALTVTLPMQRIICPDICVSVVDMMSLLTHHLSYHILVESTVIESAMISVRMADAMFYAIQEAVLLVVYKYL